MEIEERCRALVAELGLATPDGIREIAPLTGGVASDIARVDLPGRRIAAKFALPKLKVAEDWFAPVHRNRAEYAWLCVASEICPEAAVQVFGRSEALHGFAMAYLDGPDVYLWKEALLFGTAPAGEAAAVGDMLGRIHGGSTAPGFDTAPFDTMEDFDALRIDPYLRFTATRHPDLAAPLEALADGLRDRRAVLIHGDVSPKNIVFRRSGPVILDAECATMGDPAFDVGFCLNHLLLKAVHLPQMRATLLAEPGALWRAYAAHVTWEDRAALERRVAALLPALMLARVDGKSPVEYLDDAARERVRRIAIPMVARAPGSLDEICKTVMEMTGP